MTTGRAIHRADDGTETDITEGIQTLYDLVLSSMNWGSGFWSWEDALPVAIIGRLLGFEKIDEAERYLMARKAELERNPAWLASLGPEPQLAHLHVLNAAGRCMWPGCSHGVKGPEA